MGLMPRFAKDSAQNNVQEVLQNKLTYEKKNITSTKGNTNYKDIKIDNK